MLYKVTTHLFIGLSIRRCVAFICDFYSFSYEYDDNIVEEYSYAPIGTVLDDSTLIERHNYSYSGEDNQLIVYNGEAIVYNEDENPTSYSGASLAWDGDKLISYTFTDESGVEKRILYTYDEDSYIASRTIQKKQGSSSDLYEDEEKYEYTWAYDKVINQVHTKYKADQEPQQTVIKFVYDSFNCVQGFLVDDSGVYLYLKNLKGDIVGIVDETGNIVADYQYGSWGKTTITVDENTEESVSSIIEQLPLAYRGCCYDNLINLYFVEKRFYNPEWGRFLNTTEGESTDLPSATDYELYTYWENHPFWYTDGAEKEAYAANSKANFIHNQNFTNEMFSETNGKLGFIHDQTEYEKTKDNWYPIEYRYGVNITNNASCGWVATYNACLLLGNPVPPEEIIGGYEESGIFLYGIFGTHPLAIARFFIKEGYDVKIFFDDFDTNAVTDGVNILFYEKSILDHYIAIKYDGSKFLGYNVYNRNTDAVELECDSKTITYIDSSNTRNTYDGKLLISVSPKK